jgi:hypothetical protein
MSFDNRPPKERDPDMPWSIRSSAVIELLVVLFQVLGFVALCLSRLRPGTRWAERGRVGFVVALVGLGAAGALCGQHGSEFGLFAGFTLTALFIGMCIGGSSPDASRHGGIRMGAELPPLR